MVCTVCDAAIANTPAAMLERLAIPEAAIVQWVTTVSVHNGAPMAIATLQSPKSADSILAFYRHIWMVEENSAIPGYVESSLTDWQLISRLHDGFNIVIQLNTEQQNGASGLISVMRVDKSTIREDHGEFSDLTLLSSHHSVDGADKSDMRVYASSASVSQTHERYRRRLVRKGWQLVSDSEVAGSHVMVLARDQARLEISIVDSPDYGAVLVAHRVSST